MDIHEYNRQINKCFNRQNEIYCEWARAHGISYNTMMLLYALKINSSITQKQINEEWLIPKQTVNTIIKSMERKGYVRIEQISGSREKTVQLTEAGHAYADQCLQGLFDREERALRSLGRAACEHLLQCTLDYTRALEWEMCRRG